MGAPFKRPLPQHRPKAPIANRYLDTSMEVVRYVHDNLDKIRAVADHLTPVEDLVDFQEQIALLHQDLGALVEASHLLLQATPAGLDLLRAADAAAQRLLLGLGSAALRDEAYFAKTSEFLLARQDLDQALGSLSTLQGSTASLAGRLDLVETELALLRQDLAALVARFNQGDVGIGGDLQLILNGYELRLSTTEGDLAAQLSLIQQAVARITLNEDGISSHAALITAINTSVSNLETGVAANASALQILQSTSTIHGDNISAHSQHLIQLDAQILDTNNNLAANSTAISQLTSYAQSIDGNVDILSGQLSQLDVRLVAAEAGIVADGQAINNLSTQITTQGNNITVISEDITALEARVGPSGNLVPNAEFLVDTLGWTLVGTPDWAGATLGRDTGQASFMPPGTSALLLSGTDVAATGSIGATTTKLPVTGGGYIIPSSYLASEGCTVRLEWRAYDAAGVLLDQGIAGIVTGVPTDSNLLAWPRKFDKITLSNATASIELQVWADTLPGPFPANPKAWLLRPMLEQVDSGQMGPSLWMPGSKRVDEALATAVSQLTARVTDTEETLDIHSGSLVLLDSRLTDTEGDVTGQATALSGLEARVTSTENTLVSQTGQLTSLSSSLNTERQRIDNAERWLAQTTHRISDLTSDGILTPDEKPRVIQDYAVMLDEQPGITARAQAVDATVELTDYAAAVTALTNYMATLTTPVAWNDLSGDTYLN